MILVTGSAGYIGSQISKYFDNNGIKYIGIDDFRHSTTKNITNKKKFIRSDFNNLKKINKIIDKYKIETILHCAASSYVLEGEIKKKQYFQNNYKNTKQFIDLCKKKLVSNFIFMSSSNVYSDSNKTYFEKSKKKPKNIYGKTKLKIEKYLLKKNFNKVIILRLFNIIGLTNKFFVTNKINIHHQRLITNLFNKKKDKLIIRYKRLNNRTIYPSRDFLDIKDLLILIKKINKNLGKMNIKKIVLNIGSGKSININEIIYTCNKKFNLNIKLNYIKINHKEIMITKANIKKVNKIFKWKPRYSLLNSLESYKKYLR